MAEDTKIGISVIENFVCDVVGKTIIKVKTEEKVNKTLDAFIEILRDTATFLLGTRFATVETTQRPRAPWYNEAIGAFKVEYSKRLVPDIPSVHQKFID